MKTQNRLFALLLVLTVFFMSCTSCSKEESDPVEQIADADNDGVVDTNDNCPNESGPASNNGCPEQEESEIVVTNGVTPDDFEQYAGDIGMVINTRNIAKKGYKPKEAVVTVNATSGDYSETVALDEHSFLGQIKLSVADLTEAAVNELKEGVPVSITINDENNNPIITQDISAVIFSENAQPNELNVTDLEETPENRAIALSENQPYYVQVVNETGAPQAMAMKVNRNPAFDDILTRSSGVTWEGIDKEPDFIFNFIPIEDEINTYFIKLQEYGRFVGVSNDSEKLVKMFNFDDINDVLNASTTEFYKFIIEKKSDGKYIFISKITGKSLKVIGGVGMAADDEGNEAYWRIIANTLDWETSLLGIKYLSPMVGQPTTSFGANSTLTNCGNGSLTQTIGSAEKATSVNTVGWEERFSLTGSVSTSVTATIGMEVEAGFFGNSATYNAELSSTVEASVSMTSENSSFNETQESVEEDIFFERTVTVPSGSASLVYDVAQIFNDTRVQFVQRVRLRATESGVAVSGKALQSQLQFSKFNGVVTQVGPDFLDISIKGTATLGKVLETKSTVEDVPSSCN
ncbi:thrombospondin type 3 repeat-containing protein [Spongiivirga sp. MCCC 1A20706]|uniref:thrombospondin type 3 repeat-containing protein n=1 Tax=Spongiivirga sp. MCCC 1A20706 TaxID=3160963 RepID=UPI0039772E4F